MNDTPRPAALRDPSVSGPNDARTDSRAHFFRSNLTRVIHISILLIVLHQLVSSQVMHGAGHGHPATISYLTHEYVGMAGLVAVGAFWVWSLVRRGETRLIRFIPWFSPRALREVWLDIANQARRIARGMPPDDADGALASAVHGLGLLTLTVMAVTGTIVYFDTDHASRHQVLVVHRLVSNLMWAYLFAHAGLAVLHWLFGSDIFSRMFWVNPGRRRAHE